MKKTILDTNYVLFLRDVESTIKNGYTLVPNKSYVESAMLYSVDLYKEDHNGAIACESSPAKVFVTEYDATLFLFELQRYILAGYSINLDTVAWDSVGTKRAEVIKIDHPAMIFYSREELDQLSYDELKEIAKARDAFHRNKEQMKRNILSANPKED